MISGLTYRPKKNRWLAKWDGREYRFRPCGGGWWLCYLPGRIEGICSAPTIEECAKKASDIHRATVSAEPIESNTPKGG
jgi:hypothetical protein